MKNRFYMFFLAGILGLAFSGCSRHNTPSSGGKASGTGAQAPCIIYKTRSDYSKNVPVTLSKDKSTIVSYPDIKDIYYDGKLSYPVELEQGFLLDNRGIGPDVAFLGYTYEEYSKLLQTPSTGEMMKRLLDADPLLEMYSCGSRSEYKDIVNELNRKIKTGDFSAWRRLR
jgi:hypothetical protein